MLKFEVDSLEGLDESVKCLYEQKGERFRLKVEGIDPNSLNRPSVPQPTAPTSPSDAPAPLTAPTPQVRNPFTGEGPAPAAPATTAPAPSNP